MEPHVTPYWASTHREKKAGKETDIYTGGYIKKSVFMLKCVYREREKGATWQFILFMVTNV